MDIMDTIELYYVYSKAFMKKMFKKKKKVVPKQEPKQEPPKQEEPKRQPQKIYAYKLVINCDQESGKKYTNGSTKCENCKAQHDRKPGIHKPEPFAKIPFNEHICRDKSRQCTTHYNKPLFKPSSSSVSKPQFPPPWVAPPPMLFPTYHQQQNPMMYSLPSSRQFHQYHDYGMPYAYSNRYHDFGSYSNRW